MKIESIICEIGKMKEEMDRLEKKGRTIKEINDKYTFDKEGWLLKIEKVIIYK